MIQFGFINLFKCVGHICHFVLCFKDLAELTASKLGSLGVELIDRVKLAVVLQLSQPLIYHCFILVEQSSLSEIVAVVVETKSKHVAFVFNFFEVKSAQEDDV